MKLQKHILCLALVFALVACLLVGCGSSAGSAGSAKPAAAEKGYSVTSADGKYVLAIDENGKAQINDASGSKLGSVFIEIDEDWGRPVISTGDDADQAEVREEPTQFRVTVMEEGSEYDGALFVLNKYKLGTQCKFANPTNLYHWIPDPENNSDYLTFSETSVYHGCNLYFMSDGTLVVDAAGKIGSSDTIKWTYTKADGLKIEVPADESFGTMSIAGNDEGYFFTYELTYKDAQDLCIELSKNQRMKASGTDFLSKAVLDTVLLGQ